MTTIYSMEYNGQLNESKKKTLEYIRQHEGYNTTAVSTRLDKPFRTVDKHIRILLMLGFIERRGGKRTGGYYALKEEDILKVQGL